MSAMSQRIRENGLTRVANELEGLCCNSIRLTTTPNEAVPLGASRLGGLPDLPDDVTWPAWKNLPLAFIAQMNLEEVAKFDLDGDLPHSGIIYFFYDYQNQPWGFDPKDVDSCRVLYYDGPTSTLRRRNSPSGLPAESNFPSQSVVMEAKSTLPGWESLLMKPVALTDNEQDSYIQLLDDANKKRPRHQLLGHPYNIQGDMLLECQLVTNGLYCGDSSGYEDPRRVGLEKAATDWRLLLQVDSDDHGMTWGDVGHIYFWIKKQDLAKRDFAKCWLILQCY